MPKILHTSDWQIGKLFGQFASADSAFLAQARFDAVERIAALATAQAADAVLVAGDIFDAQGVADHTIHRLFNAMAGYGGPWVLIPGNHDAALAESVWTRAQRLQAIAANVTLCLAPRPVLLEAAGLAVLPAVMTQRNTYADLTEWFDGAGTPAGLVRVGLAHGSVQGLLAQGIDSPNPIAADRAERAGLDYLALGDWHGTRQVDARTWYSGTPETDRFRANDSGQALWVDLPGPGAAPVITPMQTGCYRWHGAAFELRVPADAEQAVAALRRFGRHDVVQLVVSGEIDLAGHTRLLAAIEQARGLTRGLLCDLDDLRLQPTADDIAALHADGYLGEVIADLRAAQSGAQAAVARDALAILSSVLNASGGAPVPAATPPSETSASTLTGAGQS